ncbi:MULTISPECIES: 2-hydroxychromene-2-carboxylate isomerase [Pseudomonas]|uniref:2-hydroxychromene-2-carboxylate isomerase n=1 Tax=Pseudomonas TaxID=286 RepID=UPI00046762CF|nr:MULTISPECIES: 2-hydroxychromene-2-carboxylate isomerase [Pseudomonas]TEK45312.1 2-hydroxychromene-2-carboxylate isomerase [Pseudomonas aeruginosa]TEK58440.1 2-hydroxychromene-2-carboxylate isomerase [Pseudomonas aeruginosa]TEK73961.1 2-hydroxychromene-2-carboxylate isomerase [Pseudomonas aeruginosa]TEK78436.1 2-hydroxychromene-2-carboxylate isomerase [Pseudomonas aeruginosa]TEK82818.1 2-hydroxychromene-2-carboxylate isomerase [Pseudomonas aeruginosa]
MIVDFYFDFLSPFSYLANQRLSKLAQDHGLTIRYNAIDLARVKIAIGNVGPSNRDLEVKLDYLKVDLQRWAQLYGIPLVFPANYNSRRMNTGLYYSEAEVQAAAYVNVVFNAIWGEGIAPDLESLPALVSEKLGWDRSAFERFLSSNAATERYDEQTHFAIERKVFGVPTMFLGDEMWWGNDRLFMLESAMGRLCRKNADLSS